MFDDIRLPVDVEQGAKGGPSFQTSIVALSSGNEQRNEDWSAPRQKWDIAYGINDRIGYTAVREFFMARHGRAHGFRFKDWSDYQVADQLLGVGTGTRRTFLLIKSYEDDGPAAFVRRITRPILSTLVVRVNGTLNTNYTTGDGGWIRFNPGGAPAADAEVTADFEFDVPVRFDVDDFPLTLAWSEAGEIGSLPVVETRDDFNAAPDEVVISNPMATIDENTSTATRIKVADISVGDDPFGTDTLSLSGADAAFFELTGGSPVAAERDGAQLFIKAGVVLDYEKKNSYSVDINVDDATLAGSHPFATATFEITVNDVNEAPSVHLVNTHVVFIEGTSTAAPLHVADVVVVDDALGLRALTLTGADAVMFQLSGSLSATSVDPVTGLTNYTGVALQTIVGLDYSVQKTFNVTVNVADSGLASPPQGTVPFRLSFGVTPGTTSSTGTGAKTLTVPAYTTLTIEGWGPGGGANGYNTAGSDGSAATTIASLGLSAGPGLAPLADSNIGGLGGVATGGDTNLNGTPGNSGVVFNKNYGTVNNNPFTNPTGFQFYTAAGGAAGDGLGAGQPSTGAFYSFSFQDPPAAINVNGNNATALGGGGAGALQYGIQSAYYTSGVFQTIVTYGKGAPSGGGGAKFTKTFVYGVTPGAPTPGDTLNYIVGAKGMGGVSFANGGNGFDGGVKFTWS